MNMKLLLLSNISIALFCSHLAGSSVHESFDVYKDQNGIEYCFKLAQHDDIPQLLDLINKEAIYDADKIVILPKKFREVVLQSAIDKKRIFIAINQNKIVGYKKLFLVTEDQEKEDMLSNEIRCIDNEEDCTFAGRITPDGEFQQDQYTSAADSYLICIYNGADFTLPMYREKGINKHLTQFALASLVDEIQNTLRLLHADKITMLYGITQDNAGKYRGDPSDRTLSIYKTFIHFIRLLENKQNVSSLYHKRYIAFMPTFDPESEILVPLPDTQSIQGFGCILTYACEENNE